MRKLNLLLFCALATITFSQTAIAQSKFDKWTKLKAFHTVMSQTFHPSEEGNLDPIKARITEMVGKAEILSKSKIPLEFNSKEVKSAINKLVKESKNLEKKIQFKESDEVITKTLSKVHDVFHEIVGLCTSEEHD